MCTEFILILVYFFSLFFINLLLFNLLKGYIKKITFLTKFQQIFKLSLKKNFKNLSLFYFLKNKKIMQSKYIKLIDKKNFPEEDLLILGSSYKYFLNFTEKEKNYYLNLLADQYLSVFK